MIHLEKEPPAVGQWVDHAFSLSLHFLRAAQQLPLRALLLIVLLPNALEVRAYDADGERHHAEAPDGRNARRDLAKVRGGVHVAVTDGRRGHQRPPEGVGDRLEGARRHLPDVATRGVRDHPRGGPQVLACRRVVVPLLDEVHDRAEDHHVQTEIQDQDPEDVKRTLHRLCDDHDRLKTPAQSKSSDHAHEACELQEHQGAALAGARRTRWVRSPLRESPGGIRGQDGRQVYKAGPGADKLPSTLGPGGRGEQLFGASEFDKFLLVDQLHAHGACRQQAQGILNSKQDDANGVNPLEGFMCLRLTGRAGPRLQFRQRGDYKAARR
mmetsp:Transcript_38373/g.114635  ORF Transcript_38373/g.114635 Transcript_38373/m.114635 type:complete len:325 (-) Transcript_38373:371-1345(-)